MLPRPLACNWWPDIHPLFPAAMAGLVRSKLHPTFKVVVQHAEEHAKAAAREVVLVAQLHKLVIICRQHGRHQLLC